LVWTRRRELQRTLTWLETEHLVYWRGQQRLRGHDRDQARADLRAKTMFKDASGKTREAIDEKKTLAIALRGWMRRSKRSWRSRSGLRG